MRNILTLVGSNVAILFTLFLLLGNTVRAQDVEANTESDRKVKAFLERNRDQWHDLNVPASDGQLLYDIIVEKGYTRGLEIGTSTGHSAIWIGWAFSKTGGRLITIEIDETRYKQAIANIKEAGLSDYIDVRLADAHELVKQLDGPFDFVFSDADKDWYINYFKEVSPKMERGGCFAAHNVRPRGQGGMRGTRAYLEYVQSLENFKTTVDNSGGGLAISYKQ